MPTNLIGLFSSFQCANYRQNDDFLPISGYFSDHFEKHPLLGIFRFFPFKMQDYAAIYCFVIKQNPGVLRGKNIQFYINFSVQNIPKKATGILNFISFFFSFLCPNYGQEAHLACLRTFWRQFEKRTLFGITRILKYARLYCQVLISFHFTHTHTHTHTRQQILVFPNSQFLPTLSRGTWELIFFLMLFKFSQEVSKHLIIFIIRMQKKRIRHIVDSL